MLNIALGFFLTVLAVAVDGFAGPHMVPSRYDISRPLTHHGCKALTESIIVHNFKNFKIESSDNYGVWAISTKTDHSILVPCPHGAEDLFFVAGGYKRDETTEKIAKKFAKLFTSKWGEPFQQVVLPEPTHGYPSTSLNVSFYRGRRGLSENECNAAAKSAFRTLPSEYKLKLSPKHGNVHAESPYVTLHAYCKEGYSRVYFTGTKPAIMRDSELQTLVDQLSLEFEAYINR